MFVVCYSHTIVRVFVCVCVCMAVWLRVCVTVCIEGVCGERIRLIWLCLVTFVSLKVLLRQ